MDNRQEKYDDVALGRDMESGLDGKGNGQHVEDPVSMRPTGKRTFQAPEFLRNMSPEERLHLEYKLKRKIDLRLLPMIVLMYIMNYLDRVSRKAPNAD